jgi:hypothetical protein
VVECMPPCSDQTSMCSCTHLTGGAGAASLSFLSAASNAAAKAAALDAQLERERQLAAMVCSLENKDACLMCGS